MPFPDSEPFILIMERFGKSADHGRRVGLGHGEAPGSGSDHHHELPLPRSLHAFLPCRAAVHQAEEVPRRLLVSQQLGEELAEGGDPAVRGRADERALGPGVQHPLAFGVPFGVVGVEESRRGPAPDLGGEFPAEVDRIQQSGVQPQPPAGRWIRAASPASSTRPAR
jgi:hypothetical protein